MIALSKDFLLAFSNVQKSHQKKVREFFEKFQVHPEADGLDYEPIQSARDKNFYSVRIDQAYRAVIAKTDPSVYVLMWVGHHDEGYRWAERTGRHVTRPSAASRVRDMTALPAALAAAPAAAAAPQLGALFASVKDK